MTPPASVLPLPHPWWREVAVVATVVVLGVLGGVVHVDDTLGPPPVAACLLAVGSGAVLLLRHRSPVAALAATTAYGLAVVPLDLLLTPLAVAPVAVTGHALAVRVEGRTATPFLAGSAVLLVASAAFQESLTAADVSRLATVGAVPLVAGLVGHATRNRRAYLGAVEERALRAEASREQEAHRRVEEERVRIARELHDVVAHQITLAHAQATVAAHVFDERPDQARASVHGVVETTAGALDDLRATVGLLRVPDADVGGGPTEPAEPAPGLARLPSLVETFGRAGLEVGVEHDGDPRPLPPGVDLTAYRIVQEALTNVSKHAGTGAADVRLTWHRDRVTITVTDDGAGAASSGGPGYGLIGMRERAGAVGGRLSAGRGPTGGFVVSTDLPLPAARSGRTS